MKHDFGRRKTKKNLRCSNFLKKCPQQVHLDESGKKPRRRSKLLSRGQNHNPAPSVHTNPRSVNTPLSNCIHTSFGLSRRGSEGGGGGSRECRGIEPRRLAVRLGKPDGEAQSTDSIESRHPKPRRMVRPRKNTHGTFRRTPIIKWTDEWNHQKTNNPILRGGGITAPQPKKSEKSTMPCAKNNRDHALQGLRPTLLRKGE